MKVSELQRRVENLERTHTIADDPCEFAIGGKVIKLTRDQALKGCNDAIYGVASDEAGIVMSAQFSKGMGQMLGLLRMVVHP